MLSRKSVTQFILTYLDVQLCINIASLPILIAWGLPLSILSPIGNIVFSPILTLWLTIASLVFFTQLLGLPNVYVIWFYEKISDFYVYLISFAPPHVLTCFAKPHALILILLGLSPFFILQCRLLNNPLKRIAVYTLILLCVTAMYSSHVTYGVKIIPCLPGSLTCIKTAKKVILIDPGFLNKNWADNTWFEYKLLPELSKHAGTYYIHDLVILHATKKTFENIINLINTTHIDAIYWCCSEQDYIKKLYPYFMRCKLQAQKQQTNIYILNSAKDQKILCQDSISIVKLIKEDKYWAIKGFVHQELFSVYTKQFQRRIDHG